MFVGQSEGVGPQCNELGPEAYEPYDARLKTLQAKLESFI